jgi:hypothetical protein
LCGRPSQGLGGAVTQLANMPFQDQLTQRWGVKSWKQYVDAIWIMKNRLAEKELEYRNAVMAIIQIGIGVGGMVLGLVGLLLSLVVPFLL